MKTALKEAISEIAYLWGSPSDTPNYTQIFKILEDKLEKEKQQIIDAYRIAAINNTDLDKWKFLSAEYFEISANQYFEKHFNKID